MQESWGKRKGLHGETGESNSSRREPDEDETAAGDSFSGSNHTSHPHPHPYPRPTRASLPENPSRLGDAEDGCRVSTVGLGTGRHTKETRTHLHYAMQKQVDWLCVSLFVPREVVTPAPYWRRRRRGDLIGS